MRAVLFLSVLYCVPMAYAGDWTSPLLVNVASSAPGPSAPVVIQADIAGPVEDVTITAWVRWSTNGGTSWNRSDMFRLARPGWDSTWQGSFDLPGSGTALWYVQCEDGSNWATQGPRNSSDAWPPGTSFLVQVADEPAGDMTNNPDGPFLDMTGVHFGISGEWIYARLTNNDNQWPIKRGILGPWYLYAAGFRNPDAEQDTFSWVLAYGNILGIYDPGVYMINAYTEDFERIGDIEYNTSGNVLSMRCRISTLTSHPKFGPWPVPSGHLRAARGDTRSVTLSQNSYVHDTTNQSRWYVDRSPAFTIGQNRPPTLTFSNVEPREGGPGTEFLFSTTYTDPDSNLPLLRAVVVDAETIEMIPNSRRWWRPCAFTVRRAGFAPGVRRFRFVFWDGMATVTSAPDSFLVGDTTAIVETPGSAPVVAARPNPFRRLIELTIPQSWRSAEVFSPTGELVRRFLPGRHSWDGTDEEGRLLPSGIYYLRSRLGDARLRLLRLGH